MALAPQRELPANTLQVPNQMHVTPISNARQAPKANTLQMHVNPVTTTIDNAFDYGNQLWRLETYNDRNGKPIAKRVVRFAAPRATQTIGQVTTEIQEKLKQRPGKGRTAAARAEAERNRLLAESLATRLRGVKTSRGRNDSKRRKSSRKKRDTVATGGRGVLPGVREVSRDDNPTYLH